MPPLRPIRHEPRARVLAGLALSVVGAVLIGCAAGTPNKPPDPGTQRPVISPSAGRDPDAVALETLARLAALQAQRVDPDAVLVQVSLDGTGGQRTFRFANFTTGRGIDVHWSSATGSGEEFEVVLPDVAYYAGQPKRRIDLQALRIGHATIAQAATDHWLGCGMRSLMVTGQGDNLTWYVFCELPEGVVSATVDNRTGVFRPSAAPPVRPPPTATPY